MQHYNTNLDTLAMHGNSIDALLSDSVDGMLVIDRNRRVVSASPGCERITGHPVAEMIGSECHSVTECEDQHGRPLGGPLCPATRVLSGEMPSDTQRMQYKHRDGRQIWIESTFMPMRDATGQVSCVIAIMREVSPVDGFSVASHPDSMLNDEALDTPAGGGDHDNNALDQVLHFVEKREILGALRRSHGQRSRAARTLGISRSRLYRRMEALGIDPRVDV